MPRQRGAPALYPDTRMASSRERLPAARSSNTFPDSPMAMREAHSMSMALRPGLPPWRDDPVFLRDRIGSRFLRMSRTPPCQRSSKRIRR